MTDSDTDLDAMPPGSTGPTGLLYVGPTSNGMHQVQGPDGSLVSVPFSALNDQLQNDAVQHAALGSTGPTGGGPMSANPIGEAGPTNSFNTHYVTPNGDAEEPDVKQTAPATQAQPPMAPAIQHPPAPKVGEGGMSTGDAKNEIKAETDAINAQKDVDVDLAKKNADISEAGGNDMRAEQAYQAMQRSNVDAGITDTLQRAKKVADDFASAQIDPDRYWNNKSTLQKALAAFSLVVGGAASGAAGQENQALKTFNDLRNRDLESQKYNIEHGKEASEMYSKLLTDYRATGLDERQAHEATINTIKDRQHQDMATAAFKAGGDQARALALKSLAPLNSAVKQKYENIAKTHADTQQALAGAGHTRMETAQMGIGMGLQQALADAQTHLGQGYGYQQLQPMERRALLQSAQANKTLVPDVGIARREPTTDELAQLRDISSVESRVKDLDEITKSGWNVASPEARERAVTAAQLLQAQLPKALGSQARLNEGTEHALANTVPENPDSLFSFWNAHSHELKKALKQGKSGLYNGPGGLGMIPFVNDETEQQAAAGGAIKRK